MISKPKRYEIYYADLNPSIGSELKKIRPVVIVSQDEMNWNLDTVDVCPLTSSIHPQWRSRIRITCDGNPSEIAVDQIRTISKRRLKQQIDRLSLGNSAKLRQLIYEMYGQS